jgi:uncharacterized protein YhbP (UPF0306 family)
MNDSTWSAQGTARSFVDDISTLSLATCNGDHPWAATVFFAADKHFNLYFVSDHRTRHGSDMASNAKVAVTINPECDNWHAVRGLQISGRVSVVDGVERAKALAIYLKKFPQIDALFASPKGEHEETIATRLKAANFYKIKPGIIRVIDNEQGFGFREEFIPRD